jgi:FkbM family methyltransferase
MAQYYAERRPTLRRTSRFAIALDPEDTAFICPSIAEFGWYELATTELLEELVRPGATVVDVGSNVGWFTMLAASLVGPKGRVLAFEPESRSRRLLEQSVRLNQFANVTIYPCAVSDREGEALLHHAPGPNRGAHSIPRDFGHGGEIVQTRRLDEVLAEEGIGEVNFLKVDVEGGEPAVLRGTREALDSGRIQYMSLEWNPEAWAGRRAEGMAALGSFAAFPYDGQLPFRELRRCVPAQIDEPGCLFLERYA